MDDILIFMKSEHGFCCVETAAPELLKIIFAAFYPPYLQDGQSL